MNNLYDLVYIGLINFFVLVVLINYSIIFEKLMLYLIYRC